MANNTPLKMHPGGSVSEGFKLRYTDLHTRRNDARFRVGRVGIRDSFIFILQQRFDSSRATLQSQRESCGSFLCIVMNENWAENSSSRPIIHARRNPSMVMDQTWKPRFFKGKLTEEFQGLLIRKSHPGNYQDDLSRKKPEYFS
jgi:hypothetical protein